MKNDMFSASENEIRFGDYTKNVNFHKYEHLFEVEEYFLQIGRAHVYTQVPPITRMPYSAWKK